MKTDQFDETEFWNDFAIEEQRNDAEINRHNTRLLKVLLDVNGFEWVTKFLKDYHESECFNKITFTKEPLGQQQKSYWGATEGVYVNQHCDGEDSYWGEIYFPVKEGKYLRCPFAC